MSRIRLSDPWKLRLGVLLGALVLGVTVLSVALIRPQGATSASDPSNPTFGVLGNGGTIDASLAKRLPGFVDGDSARLAYADDTGSYLAAKSDIGEVCVVWLAAAGGNYTSCQKFDDRVEGHPPIVSVLSGGYGAGAQQRLVGLVPDFIDTARLPDGRTLEIKNNVFTAPADSLAIEISGAGASWQIP